MARKIGGYLSACDTHKLKIIVFKRFLLFPLQTKLVNYPLYGDKSENLPTKHLLMVKKLKTPRFYNGQRCCSKDILKVLRMIQIEHFEEPQWLILNLPLDHLKSGWGICSVLDLS